MRGSSHSQKPRGSRAEHLKAYAESRGSKFIAACVIIAGQAWLSNTLELNPVWLFPVLIESTTFGYELDSERSSNESKPTDSRSRSLDVCYRGVHHCRMLMFRQHRRNQPRQRWNDERERQQQLRGRNERQLGGRHDGRERLRSEHRNSVALIPAGSVADGI
jgi:hypothetical protein